MTQAVFLAHWLGGAIVLQSLMELYVYRKKTEESPPTLQS